MTPLQCDQLRAEMRRLIDSSEALKKMNFKLKIGTMRYSEAEISFRIEASDNDAPSKQMLDLCRYAKVRGYDKTMDLEKTGKDGERLVGYKPRSSKYPFVIQKSNGKQYKITERYASVLFAA